MKYIVTIILVHHSLVNGVSKTDTTSHTREFAILDSARAMYFRERNYISEEKKKDHKGVAYFNEHITCTLDSVKGPIITH
jgi:hypothetical protein